MSRLLESMESASRAGPSVILSLGRAVVRGLMFGVVMGAMLGVVVGAPLGYSADTADEAHLPADMIDIDIRDADREPVDQPFVPDVLEEPVIDTGEPPEWYLDGIQMFIDAVIGTAVLSANLTAQFTFENKWIPQQAIQGIGLVGFFGAFALRYVRLFDSIMRTH